MSGFTRVALALLIPAFAGCALFPETGGPPLAPLSMKRLKRFRAALTDDMSFESLKLASAESIAYLEKIDPDTSMKFGDRSVTPDVMIESHRRLIRIFEEEADPMERSRRIGREFDVYKGTGATEGGNVFITGYYQPLLKAAREWNVIFRWPIYKRPDDLVRVNLGLFSGELKGKTITGRVDDGRLVPYYDRRAIDREGALSEKDLEAAWVMDPVDLFFLHVQGSGVIEYRDGTREFINYAASNGREYRSIGKLLIDEMEIPPDKMSLQAIRSWLWARPDKLEATLDHNPSYVFFRAMDDGPFGSTGAKLVPGRSAAFDPAKFPKGALAHIAADLPVAESGEGGDGGDGGEIAGWRSVSRFVFSHDQGGAIKGAGRMDLFMGLGEDAGAAAGVMKHPGELLFLLLKKEVYKKIAETR